MRVEHYILIAKFCHEMYFAASLGRKKYPFLKQQYERMMPEPLQPHPNSLNFLQDICSF